MANVKHGVVRTDLLDGTDVRAALVSIEYMGADGKTETAIDNGCVLKVGMLKEGEREIYVGSAPEATDELKDIVLIATPEVMYDERLRNLDDFYNEAGTPCRGYRLRSGNVFSVTKAALDGNEEPAVGDLVELQNDVLLNVVSEATEGATAIGKIIAVDVVGRHTYYAICVL